MIDEAELIAICDELACGKSLRAICRERGLAESNVRRWMAKSDEAMAHSAHARELGCDALADECIELADDKTIDPAHKRIMVDTRLRLIGKWSQRYGDKVTVNSNSTVTHRYDLDSLEDSQLDDLERILAHARAGAGDNGASEPAAVH
jgi:hypothetical protein